MRGVAWSPKIFFHIFYFRRPRKPVRLIFVVPENRYVLSWVSLVELQYPEGGRLVFGAALERRKHADLHRDHDEQS